jgi:hypothetical protein
MEMALQRVDLLGASGSGIQQEMIGYCERGSRYRN